jgi:transcriptional regulator
MRANVDLVRGTLDVMILKALSFGPRHGLDVARWIHQVTGDALRIEEGSLYPALHRLEERGFIDSEWGLSDNNRKAKYYRLTPGGRRRLRRETGAMNRFARTLAKVLTARAPRTENG